MGNKLKVLGVMSGTSLDGLDLALCEFEAKEDGYTYKIIKAETVPYGLFWKDALASTPNLFLANYFSEHHKYGKYIAEQIQLFLKDSPIKPVAIASHGHTIFHQPHKGFSIQLGCGATIAANTGITTVCDFRSLDVANGGQGAPLVPIGDKILFSEYDSCLNIGGIANISHKNNSERPAYDICFANMALNYLAEKLGKPYDENGNFAASGKVNETWLEQIKKAITLSTKISLAREQFEERLMDILDQPTISTEDKLASFCNYIAEKIALDLNVNRSKNVLITGGGAYNKFLIALIKKEFRGEVIIPQDNIIQFKEALIFALLGYLRLNEKTNTLKSVTGAKSDSVGGAVYLGTN